MNRLCRHDVMCFLLFGQSPLLACSLCPRISLHNLPRKWSLRRNYTALRCTELNADPLNGALICNFKSAPDKIGLFWKASTMENTAKRMQSIGICTPASKTWGLHTNPFCQITYAQSQNTVDSIIFLLLCLHSTRHWCQTTVEISLYNFYKNKSLKYSSSLIYFFKKIIM